MDSHGSPNWHYSGSETLLGHTWGIADAAALTQPVSDHEHERESDVRTRTEAQSEAQDVPEPSSATRPSEVALFTANADYGGADQDVVPHLEVEAPSVRLPGGPQVLEQSRAGTGSTLVSSGNQQVNNSVPQHQLANSGWSMRTGTDGTADGQRKHSYVNWGPEEHRTVRVPPAAVTFDICDGRGDFDNPIRDEPSPRSLDKEDLRFAGDREEDGTQGVDNEEAAGAPFPWEGGMSALRGAATQVAKAVAERKAVVKPPCLKPDAPWRRWWDLGMLLLALYYGVMIPLVMIGNVAFDVELACIHSVASVLSMADVLVRCRTGFVDKGKFHTDKVSIRKMALRRWGLADTISVPPADVIAWAAGSPHTALRFLVALRLARFWHQRYLFLSSEEMIITPAYVDFHFKMKPTIRATFWGTLMLNALVCLKLAVAHEDHDDDRRYDLALFWVWNLLTTSPAPLTLHSYAQKVICFLLMVCGVFFQGVVIAKVSYELLRNSLHEENVATLRTTLSLIRQYNVPVTLQQEVLSLQWHNMQSSLSGLARSNVLESLPPVMANEILLYMKIGFIDQVPFFKNAEHTTKVLLAGSLEQVYAEPDQLFMRAGEIGEEMYFILHGLCTVIVPGVGRVGQLSRGQFFGEKALLSNEKRTASVRALTYCDCLRLAKDSFETVCEQSPDFLEKIKSAAPSSSKESPTPAPPSAPGIRASIAAAATSQREDEKPLGKGGKRAKFRPRLNPLQAQHGETLDDSANLTAAVRDTMGMNAEELVYMLAQGQADEAKQRTRGTSLALLEMLQGDHQGSETTGDGGTVAGSSSVKRKATLPGRASTTDRPIGQLGRILNASFRRIASSTDGSAPQRKSQLWSSKLVPISPLAHGISTNSSVSPGFEPRRRESAERRLSTSWSDGLGWSSKPGTPASVPSPPRGVLRRSRADAHSSTPPVTLRNRSEVPVLSLDRGVPAERLDGTVTTTASSPIAEDFQTGGSINTPRSEEPQIAVQMQSEQDAKEAGSPTTGRPGTAFKFGSRHCASAKVDALPQSVHASLPAIFRMLTSMSNELGALRRELNSFRSTTERRIDNLRTVVDLDILSRLETKVSSERSRGHRVDTLTSSFHHF